MEGPRVHERDEPPAVAPSRLLVDHLEALRPQVRDRLPDVRHGERDVVHPLPALLDEPRDHPVRPHGLQELEAGAALHHERDPDALGLHGLRRAHREAHRPIPGNRRVEARDRDPDVVEVPDHISLLARYAPKISRIAPAISPRVALAFTASRITGTRFVSRAAASRTAVRVFFASSAFRKKRNALTRSTCSRSRDAPTRWGRGRAASSD